MLVVTILGSNSGDKWHLLLRAEELLTEAGKIVRKSAVYETAPWGFECEENFLNQVIVFDTLLSPRDFLNHCLSVEKQLGRVRNNNGPRYSSRPIDVDILFYDSCVLHESDLTIPHPRLCERRFVLVPLAEILPDFIHPENGCSIRELLERCEDVNNVGNV